MQLSQFLDLLKYTVSFSEKHQILTEYSELLSITNAAKKENLSTQQISKIKEILNKTNTFHSLIVTESNHKFISSVISIIDIKGVLGSIASNKINKAAENFENDPKPLAKCISQIKDETSQLLNQLTFDVKKIEKILAVNFVEKSENVIDASHQFCIEFSREATNSTMAELEKNARIWNSILNAFIVVTHSNSTDIQIFEISKNKIEIFSNDNVIASLAKGLTSILNSYYKTLDILKLQLEIYQLSLSRNKEIDILLEDEMKDILQNNTANVVQEIITQYQWIGDNKEEDIYRMLNISLIQVFGFFEKGGRISTRIESEINQLNSNINKVIIELEILRKKLNHQEHFENSEILHSM